MTADAPHGGFGRNDPCWCRSGKKFKNCHMGRETERPRDKNELFKFLAKQKTLLKRCMHPEAPKNCGKVVKSHIIQMRRQLEAIASNGHVLKFHTDLPQMLETEGRVGTRRVGIRQALRLPMFCEYHDSTLFAPIEQQKIVPTAQQIHLICFRALCYELYTKLSVIDTFEKTLTFGDKGRDLSGQMALQALMRTHLGSQRVSVRDMSEDKRLYDADILSGDLTSFRYYAVEFDSVLPFLCSNGWLPVTDFNDVALQDLSRANERMEGAHFSTFVSENRGLIVFGWYDGPNRVAERWVSSFRAIPKDRKANRFVQFMFYGSDCLFFGEQWWNGLDANDRKTLTDRFNSVSDSGWATLKDIGLNVVQCLAVNETVGY